MPREPKRLLLTRELTELRDRYASDVLIVRDLVSDTESILEARMKESSVWVRSEASDAERSAVLTFGRLLTQAAQQIRAGRARRKRYRRVKVPTKRVSDMFLLFATHQRALGFLPEMAVVYLVALQEAFTRDVLESVYRHLRVKMRCDKTLTFKEVCEHDSMESLLAYMARHMVARSDQDKGIDRVAEYLDVQFKVKLAADTRFWPHVREASLRRNVIVHNKGVADREYCSRLGRSTPGRQLSTNVPYVRRLVRALHAFFSYTVAGVANNLRLGPLRPLALPPRAFGFGDSDDTTEVMAVPEP